MTNAELIKALRHCGAGGDVAERCLPCDYYDSEPWCEAALVNDAADALEAAEHRIEDLEGALAACRMRKDGRLPKDGEWIKHGCEEDEFTYWECPFCGFIGLEYHYCPNCGARMRKGELL